MRRRVKTQRVERAEPVFAKRLLVASGNPNKILELQTVAREFGLELISPTTVGQKKGLPTPPQVGEDGDTYWENALIKARAYAKWSGMPAIGDDSGLEVIALEFRPGVHSARYAGPGAPDSIRIAKLLEEFKGLATVRPEIDRTAYFRCTLVLAYPNGALLSAEGELKGSILDEPRGDKGFGYDPIVLIDELGQTLAEVDFNVTCDKGFRARAARELFRKLLALKKRAPAELKPSSRKRKKKLN